MALIRWADDSDVYIYEAGDENHQPYGSKTVLVCMPLPGESFTAHSYSEMIAHLWKLHCGGYMVPERAFNALREACERDGDRLMPKKGKGKR